tara:strand:+ start:12697 stop:13995 length:1299 start_codon:yes stop_codon:yes gene_type:complete
MGCKIGFDHKFLVTNLNDSFVKKDYREHRRHVLFEEQQARIPNIQPLVQDQIEIERIENLNKSDLAQIKALNERVKLLRQQVYSRQYTISLIKRGQKPGVKEKREFIMPCPDEECKGFLSSGYKCGLCNKKACPHCITIISEDEEHVCDPDLVATAALIKKDTKPCPTCGERIMKIDGCDQMWCTKCHTTFSWNKGVIEKGNIHNPHYYQWLREQSADGTIPRAPGDAGRDVWADMRQRIQQHVDNAKLRETHLKFASQTHMYMNHLNGAVRRENQFPQLYHNRPNVNNTIANMTRDEGELVKFLRKQISEKKFRDGLALREKQRRIETDLQNIYTMYATELDKCFKALQGIVKAPAFVKNELKQMLKVHLKYIRLLMEHSHVCKNQVCILAIGQQTWRGYQQYSSMDIVKLDGIKTVDEFCQMTVSRMRWR